MLKRDQIGDLNSQWNKALSHERVFVLLGRDLHAPTVIRYWADLRAEDGDGDDAAINEARACADKMEQEVSTIRNELTEKAVQSGSTREYLRKVVGAAWTAAKGGETPAEKVVDQIINTAITAEEKV